jgi:DNA polymerase III delta subunit
MNAGILNNTRIAPVTILSGNEPIGMERARLNCIAAVRAAHSDCTIEKFDHASDKINDFLESMLTPSLFQNTRVFIINHCQELSDSDLKALDRVLKEPIPDVYLIIGIDDQKRGKEEVSIAKKLHLKKRAADTERFAMMEFEKPPDYKLSQWLTAQVPVLLGRRIGKTEADCLVDTVGTDLDTLYSELQKIDIHLAPDAPIQRDDIETIAGASRQMTVFELAGALGTRNLVRSLQVIDSLFSGSFAAPVMTATLFRHFWALFRIRRFAESNASVMKQFNSRGSYPNTAQNEAAFEIGKAAGLLRESEQRKIYPVMIASGIVPQARSFSDKELKTILRLLLDFDVGVKTGRVNPDRHAVQLLCYRIVRSKELLDAELYG